MSDRTAKHSGHSWDVYFVYFDGEDDSMQVEGLWTAEEAIAQARAALNAYCKSDDEKDQFEIVAVVRSDAEI
jgi:hypothetical protein